MDCCAWGKREYSSSVLEMAGVKRELPGKGISPAMSYSILQKSLDCFRIKSPCYMRPNMEALDWMEMSCTSSTLLLSCSHLWHTSSLPSPCSFSLPPWKPPPHFPSVTALLPSCLDDCLIVKHWCLLVLSEHPLVLSYPFWHVPTLCHSHF